MRFNKKNIIAGILSLCMILGMIQFSVAAAEQDISSYAVLECDFPVQPPSYQHSITFVCDGKDNTSIASDRDATFTLPVHFTISFGEMNAEIRDITLGSRLGAYMGISKFDFEYKEGGEWKKILAGMDVPWEYSDATYEEMSFHLPKSVVANEFRLTVLETNLYQFRLEELKMFGSMKGLANPIQITGMKPIYVQTMVGRAAKLPGKITVMSGEEEKELSVNWDENTTFQKTGIYTVKGKIPYYTEEPVAVIDVYDSNRDISSYDGNWAYEMVSKSAKSGLSNGVELNPSRILDRKDSSQMIFRKAVGEFSESETQFSDVTPCNEMCAIYQAMTDRGCFEIQDGKYQPDQKTSRIEFLKALVSAEQDTLSEKIDLPYQDISGLDEQGKTALKIGLEKGIITSAERFRPDDGITLGEALVILNTVTNSAETTVSFADNNTVIRNPDMGIYSYYYDNSLNSYDVSYGVDDTIQLYRDHPEIGSVYLRFSWRNIEPNKGEYDFSMIDSAIQQFSELGMQIALRITSAETSRYSTPQWVFDEGCKSFIYGENGMDPNGPYMIPDFDDPVYLEYQKKFVAEFGKRYNGNPNIAFVDVGNLGVWGEGHTYTSGVNYTKETAQTCIDMYKDAFPDTKVFVMNMTQKYDQLIDYVIENGLGWRNDGFWVYNSYLYVPKEQYERFWRTNPVNMEAQHWDRRVEWNADEAFEAFSTIHPTFFGLHGYVGSIMDSVDADFVTKAAKRIGYRFLPETVTLTNQANAHGYLNLNVVWRNNGCAPAYRDYYPAITLKNKNGNIETTMVDPSFSMAAVESDSSLVEQVKLKLNSTLPGGEYEAYLSVGKLDGTPVVALPINGDDGNKRYHIGKVSVRPDYEVTAQQISGTNKLRITMTPYSDMVGNYKIWQTSVCFYEKGGAVKGVYGELCEHLSSELNEEFNRGMNEKTTVSADTSEFRMNSSMLERLKNKEMIVKIRFFNEGESANNSYRATGRDGIFTEIGTAVFDDNGSMTFTPRQ